MDLVIVGRTAEKIELVASEIAGSAKTFTADVTKEDEVNAALHFSAQQGDIGAVIYNAGNNAIIPFDDLTAESFEDFWRICCFGAFLTAKAALPHLLKGGGGSLLFTGASGSMRGRARFAHFASAKAGLRNLAQALAREYGAQGIHIGHVVVDGLIDGQRLRDLAQEYLDAQGKDGALKPDDMAENFWYLHTQPRNSWTHEIDLRPFKENW
jgi:short-subunit dehydrogenase